jgi:glycosyltransferase involved in cell wall biosynthesis
MKTLAVIIPCYNEEQSLPAVLHELIPYCKQRQWPIICINDGSKDKTLEILNNYSEEITVLNHKVNKGYGGAIKTGISFSKTDYCVTIDADGQHYFEDIDKVFARCLESDADMVIGSRLGNKDATWLRGLGKSIIRTIAKILMPIEIYDINSGMKLYRTDLAKKYITLYPNTMAFSDIIALVFINQRHLVLETPIRIKDRIAGVSTIGVSTAFTTIHEIISIVTMFNPMRIFLPISFISIILGLIWGSWILIQGRGLSVGSSFFILSGIIVFLLGLISEQLSLFRIQAIKERND